jgi:magnesium transporter
MVDAFKLPRELFIKPLLKIKSPFTRHYAGERVKRPGSAPGKLIHVGKKRVSKVQVSTIDYGRNTVKEINDVPIGSLASYTNSSTVTWINIVGLHDTEAIKKIGEQFDLHPLLLEDVVNTEQRPKQEDYEENLFVVLKMFLYNAEKKIIESEQVSIVIGSNYVLSFLETPGDVFDPVRERIRKSKVKFRRSGSDYLAYALLDAIVDNYFVILEKIGEKIEDLELALADDPKKDYLLILHNMKREMIFLRKSVLPLREVLSGMKRTESRLIKKHTKVYLKDVYDHSVQLTDTLETFREMLSGMLDLYMSSISNRMNEIMKVLTLFAAIFIPLTFITGVYGMNFQNMPELQLKYGYFIALGAMTATGIGLLTYFKKKSWI